MSLLGFVVLSHVAIAQNTPVELWQSKEFVKSSNKGPKIALDRFQNTYMVTTQTDANPLLGVTLVKYDSLGNALWNQNYPEGFFGHLYGDLVVDAVGNAYVSLIFYGIPQELGADAIVLKFSPDGTRLWEANYGLDREGNNFIEDLALDSMGRLIGLGFNDDNVVLDNNFLFVTAIDTATGAFLWDTKIPGVVTPHKLRVLADRIELLSTLYTLEGQFYAITQVDFSGNVLEQHAKPYTGYEIDFNDIAKNGDILLGNRAYGYNVTRLNQQGDTLWHYSYPLSEGYNKNWVRSVMEDDSMNVYATGGVTIPGLFLEFLTTKISPSGEVLWQDIFHMVSDSLGDTGQGLDINQAFVVATGFGQLNETENAGIIKIFNRYSGASEYDIIINPDDLGLLLSLGTPVLSGNKLFYTGVEKLMSSTNEIQVVTGCFKIPSFTSATKPLDSTTHFAAFPNPTSAMLHISDIDVAIFSHVELFDASGRIIQSINVSESNMTVDLSNCHAGMYCLKMTGKGIAVSKKIMVAD